MAKNTDYYEEENDEVSDLTHAIEKNFTEEEKVLNNNNTND